MRVFITGASGHIAAAVIPELIDNGHEVVGLARSDASAKAVAHLGAEVLRGDLDDLALLKKAASDADGVIHLAFRHDLMATGDYATAVGSDLAAIKALGEGLAGTNKPLITTGGSLMLAHSGITGRPGTEDDVSDSGPRVEAENYTVGLAEKGVRSAVIRLAPVIHSDLDHHGFTSSFIGFARDTGVAAYVGDGSNVWPAANTYDIGVLYRLALEKAPAGSRLHGVSEGGIPRRVMAETIANKLGVEARSITQEEAPYFLKFLADFGSLDNPISNVKTREVLGWEPTHVGWVQDVETGNYIP